jgi:UDP-glucose:(heptosyl)LPS alpha-1,3-glucosyltransferase
MERVFAELIRRASKDFRLVVISRELAPELRPLVEWRPVRVPPRPVPLLFSLFFVLAGVRLARTKAEVVHTLGALVPNRANLASVHFCHAAYRASSSRETAQRRPLPRRINTHVARALGLAAERWLYGRGRIPVLAAVSHGVAKELERWYPGAKIVVTPNGVDLERFRPDAAARNQLRSEVGVSEDELVGLFVGGDWDHKGVRIAIEALEHARNPSVRLWVVGQGDEERFRGIAENCGVARQVTFFGTRTDTQRFYQAADLLVLPSRYEAFPLVLLEAAACALPSVVTRVNGVEEIVGNGDAGLVVERSPDAVGAALARLASDPELRRRLGKVAHQRAAGYTWDRSASSVLEIYRQVLGEVQIASERAA